MWNTIVRGARSLKLLSFKKVLYVPHIFSSKEKKVLILLIGATLVSGWIFSARIYTQITVLTPGIGGIYREAMLREPRVINPLFATQDTDRDISRLIFAGLFTYDGNGKITPDLAENLEVSNDGKLYSVTLRQNLKWHDGMDLTSADIIFTVKTIQNPQYKSVLRPNWQGVEVEAPDSHTVKFSLRTPYAPFIENLTAGIIPKHLWERVSPEQILLNELNLKPIGAGPYKFSRFKQDKDGSIFFYAIDRNPNYHRDGPFISSINFSFFKSEEGALGALHKGAVDGFGPVSSSRLGNFPANDVSVHSIIMPRIFGIFFNNQETPQLTDKKVREAIAMAIDKKRIASELAEGSATATDAPFQLTDSSSLKNPYPYDSERAKKLLWEAGWKDKNRDGILEKQVRVKQKITTQDLRLTLTTSDWPDLRQAALLIKNELQKIGMEVTIKALPFTELESTVIRPRNFEILLFGEVYGYEPDPFAFWHSSQGKDPGLNIVRYANKKADQFLEEARRIPDELRRREKYQELANLIIEDLPAVFLYSQLYLYLLPADLKGVELNTISLPADRFNEINTWYFKTKRVLK